MIGHAIIGHHKVMPYAKVMVRNVQSRIKCNFYWSALNSYMFVASLNYAAGSAFYARSQMQILNSAPKSLLLKTGALSIVLFLSFCQFTFVLTSTEG